MIKSFICIFLNMFFIVEQPFLKLFYTVATAKAGESKVNEL